MFRTKICGITRCDDARCAAEAGAEAIGLNFFSGSPRCIDLADARRIVECLPSEIVKVGVFVSARPEVIREAAETVGLSAVQLHGDETPEQVGEVIEAVGVPVIRAFRLGELGLAPVVDELRLFEKQAVRPAMVLVDAFRRDAYGGTGETIDWEQLRNWRESLGSISLVLAGGLTPQNVAQAIATVRPDAVDTASGVESQAGIKDADAMRRFISEANAAFQRLKDGKLHDNHYKP